MLCWKILKLPHDLMSSHSSGYEYCFFISELCDAGFELLPDGKCEPCPRGYFRIANLSPNCVPCTTGLITNNTGATSADECTISEY